MMRVTQAQDESSQSDTQSILDSIRRIVKSLRETSKHLQIEDGVSAAQLFVLQKLVESDSPLRVNDLAARTLTHQSSVSVVVSKLEEKKLVERIPSAQDARVVEVRISKKGAALVRENLPLIQERLIRGISLLSPTERRGLVAGLQSLIKKAGLQGEEPSMFFEEVTKGKAV